MFLSVELREKDVANNTLLIDDVRYSPWQPERGRHSAAFSEQAICIAQEHKRELMCCSKLLPIRHFTDDVHYTLHCTVGTAIKRVVSSGCGTVLLRIPVSTITFSPLKERAKRSRLLGAGPSRNSPVTL